MASNTGCTSEGELAMTFRMSAVAVCRSSASFVSLNRRAFSIAIRPDPRKSSKVDRLASNDPASRRVMPMVPIAIPLRSIGTTSMLRQPTVRRIP